ncbi:MAG TPA: hypothetical protein VL993_02445 [Stellaceae bacterium]|nr:hypothetical protein [Stellaceae bacterium]
MKSRDRATPKKSGSKPARTKSSSAAKAIAATRKLAPVRKPAAPAKSAAAKPAPVKPAMSAQIVQLPKSASPAVAAKPAPVPTAPAGSAKPAAAPAKPAVVAKAGGQSDSAARLASAQQAEERRKAATRKLFARLRSLEAIVGADLRKRGSLLLSQAVDQWYAEAISASASDVTITNAARSVIQQL